MTKEKVQQVVVDLPDEVDVDSLVEKLYLLEKIELGERQLARGEGVPHEEVKKRLEKWLK
jgi:predicted transcriptional regulator